MWRGDRVPVQRSPEATELARSMYVREMRDGGDRSGSRNDFTAIASAAFGTTCAALLLYRPKLVDCELDDWSEVPGVTGSRHDPNPVSNPS